jgi:putative ABC transport system substrate-binding protein
VRPAKDRFRKPLSVTIFAAIILMAGALPADDGRIVPILVLESRHIKAYDAALSGFEEALNRKGFRPQLTSYILNEDLQTTEQLSALARGMGARVVLALGTDAARFAKDADLDIPSVFSMVSEPGASGLLNSGGQAGGAITGACLDVPVREQFMSLIDVVPGAKRIGVVYNPAETQLIVDEGRAVANRMNLGFVSQAVGSEAEVPKALSELRPKIDALWLVGDRTVLNTQSLQYVFLFAFQNNLPLIGLSEHFVKMGALFAVGPDYEDIGRQSGELAARILAGEEPQDLSYVSPRKVLLSLNLRTAEIIGLHIPDNVVRSASATY